MAYRTSPDPDLVRMPSGIPYIIANEAAERFSFYGMKAALAIFLANYLVVLGGDNLSEAQATAYVSTFNLSVYFTPLLGALIADSFFGKYRTIVTLSIVYCLGHLSLALMGIGGVVEFWLLAGLGLIALGAGGIKSCVSAHVGDQFGKGNQHLLTRIFNIFYFSINTGAVISNLLIPVILQWHGPHWAFGIPGVLMALATLFFWMGRHKFIHVPAKGPSFARELFSREGLTAIGKLLPLYLFVAVFWCLFDQTANTLVFQAERMNRDFGFFQVLPSQIQAFNPFLILVLIPLFTFFIYPAVGRRIRLTPLRKIGTGLFLMVLSFAVIAWAQEAIDRGETPHVGWQLLAYLIFTTAEILISIVCLEFSYTQAPKKMKSLIMGIFLLSVAFGNLITAGINIYIQVPSPLKEVPAGQAVAGYDQQAGTDDDLTSDGEVITSLVTGTLETLAARVSAHFEEEKALPTSLDGLPEDPWGNPFRYELVHAKKARITSDGPDGKAKTKWDLGILFEIPGSDREKEGTWLYREKEKKGLLEATGDQGAPALKQTYTAGGGLKLEGAAYFWFFTILMLVTAVLFVPFSLLYKERTYLQE